MPRTCCCPVEEMKTTRRFPYTDWFPSRRIVSSRTGVPAVGEVLGLAHLETDRLRDVRLERDLARRVSDELVGKGLARSRLPDLLEGAVGEHTQVCEGNPIGRGLTARVDHRQFGRALSSLEH